MKFARINLIILTASQQCRNFASAKITWAKFFFSPPFTAHLLQRLAIIINLPEFLSLFCRSILFAYLKFWNLETNVNLTLLKISFAYLFTLGRLFINIIFGFILYDGVLSVWSLYLSNVVFWTWSVPISIKTSKWVNGRIRGKNGSE